MNESGGGLGLPQNSEHEILEMLLSEDSTRTSDEPEITANIGEQMIHMETHSFVKIYADQN